MKHIINSTVVVLSMLMLMLSNVSANNTSTQKPTPCVKSSEAKAAEPKDDTNTSYACPIVGPDDERDTSRDR